MSGNFRSKEWTSKELHFVRKHADRGAHAIALELGRSVSSVKKFAHRQRISLRRDGERRGLLIGQPRTASWQDLRRHGISAERLAALKAAEATELAELERQVIRIARGPKPPICPNCGARYVERATSGWCNPCHLRMLARLHQDRMDEREAQRELWAARQQSSRSARRGDDEEDE